MKQNEKPPTCKANLATALRDRWSQINEESLSMVKSMPQRIQTVKKAMGDAAEY